MSNRASGPTPRIPLPGESQRGIAFRRQMKELAGHLYKKQREAQHSREELPQGAGGSARGNEASGETRFLGEETRTDGTANHTAPPQP